MTSESPIPDDGARLARDAIATAEEARRWLASAGARMDAAIGGVPHEVAEAAIVFLAEAYVLLDEAIESVRCGIQVVPLEAVDQSPGPH